MFGTTKCQSRPLLLLYIEGLPKLPVGHLLYVFCYNIK